VDEDWTGGLIEHVALLLRIGNKTPTPKMIETLGATGNLCLIVDSLSERSIANAADDVGVAVERGIFKYMLVTSRNAPQHGKVWEGFQLITSLPLTPEQVPAYVATYAPPERRAEIAAKIGIFAREGQSLSPLFIRFAIEQAMKADVSVTSHLELVFQYVEELRADRVDLDADDMVRAATITAREAVRGGHAPREIETGYLRGVLAAQADAMPFNNANHTGTIDAAEVIEILVNCGLLNRNRSNRNLQFAYDPVAEILARADSLRNSEAHASSNQKVASIHALPVVTIA
jgi:hypothetical protein